MKTIYVPPGIGDSLWVLMKLINSGEKFDFRLPDSAPQRGKQIFDLLPQVAASCEYQSHLTYKKIEQASFHRITNKWSGISRKEFALSANGWLEAGVRIEGFLPDLETSFRIEYQTSEQDAAIAKMLIPDGGLYFGVYGSAYSNARHWGGWEVKEWMEYIRVIAKEVPEIKFVVIGAKYDTDLAEQIMWKMGEEGIKFINTIGDPLSVVIEILKRLHYFTGFPSGLSIVNETLGKDGTMFYPHNKPKVANIMGTWANPERLLNNSFKECLFPEPEGMAKWLFEVYGLKDYLKQFERKIEKPVFPAQEVTEATNNLFTEPQERKAPPVVKKNNRR